MDKDYSRILLAMPSILTSAVLCLLVAATPSSAEPMTELEVKAAVETWLRGVITDGRADATIEDMEPHEVDGETVAYIAHLKDGGFCLCGADDLVLPVYFYSPNGVYDPDNPSHEYILWEIGARLAGHRKSLMGGDPDLESYREALVERAVRWDDLAARRIPPRPSQARAQSEPDMMVLPVTSKWSQNSPYNDACPSWAGPPGHPTPALDRPKVGCVATATAQTMYYWRWPEVGAGSYINTWLYAIFDHWEAAQLDTDPGIDPYVWQGRLEWHSGPVASLRAGAHWDNSAYNKAREISDDPDYLAALADLWSRAGWLFGAAEVDFGAATYDWDQIHDEHFDGDGVDDSEVAKLCYHVGVAVQMDWGLFLSTTNTGAAGDALHYHFGYYPGHYASRSVAAMIDEIQWLRPLIIRGNRPGQTVGHAWVAYGYDTATSPDTTLFLMNLGRGGDNDGWYACDEVDLGYTANQQHLIRISPGVVAFVGDGGPGIGWPASPYGGIAEAVDQALDGTTLIFKAGSTNTFTEASLVIDRPFTLKGLDVLVHRQ